MQFVVSTTEPFENLNVVAEKILEKARASGKFYFADVDLKVDRPQATVVVDRDKISALGMTQQDVGAALGRRWAAAMSTTSRSRGAPTR